MNSEEARKRITIENLILHSFSGNVICSWEIDMLHSKSGACPLPLAGDLRFFSQACSKTLANGPRLTTLLLFFRVARSSKPHKSLAIVYESKSDQRDISENVDNYGSTQITCRYCAKSKYIYLFCWMIGRIFSRNFPTNNPYRNIRFTNSFWRCSTIVFHFFWLGPIPHQTVTVDKSANIFYW